MRVYLNGNNIISLGALVQFAICPIKTGMKLEYYMNDDGDIIEEFGSIESHNNPVARHVYKVVKDDIS